MDAKTALRIFGVDQACTPTELTNSFRRLVKRFHPDNNPGKEEWAHRRMVVINDAFTVAREAVDLRPTTNGTAYTPTDAEDPVASRPRDLPSLNVSTARENLFDGIYTYYQYGLENVHARGQGSFKLRYRRSVRLVQSAVDEIRRLVEAHRSTHSVASGTRLLRFGHAFSENMKIDHYYVPSNRSDEVRAYRRYRYASELLDGDIQGRLFPELNGTRHREADALYISERELLFLLSHHTDSTWAPYAVIKLHLLQTFSDLTQ